MVHEFHPVPTMTDRIRLTISITPEVHLAFSQMAEAGGISLSRAIGGWLEDTLDGAQFVAAKMMEARRAPQRVMDELQGLAGQLAVGQADEVLGVIQEKARASARRGTRPRGGAVQTPAPESAPSSNTGLNSPRRRATPTAKSSKKAGRS